MLSFNFIFNFVQSHLRISLWAQRKLFVAKSFFFLAEKSFCFLFQSTNVAAWHKHNTFFVIAAVADVLYREATNSIWEIEFSSFEHRKKPSTPISFTRAEWKPHCMKKKVLPEILHHVDVIFLYASRELNVVLRCWDRYDTGSILHKSTWTTLLKYHLQ